MTKTPYNIEYKSILNLFETQKAIKFVKDSFQIEFQNKLNLMRVTAPLFVNPILGLNDNLSGVERPVKFDIPSVGIDAEIVQSLAKWKRMALHKYSIRIGKGLYTDMNAIRRDEELDYIHSVYVDQWDWEKAITKEDRTFEYLKKTVEDIYSVLKSVELKIYDRYKEFKPVLPDNITFISTSELEELYPNNTRKERENLITKKYKAVFLYQIGWPLKDNMPHDTRAADYDDWNLNGDILVYYSLYDMALELSSMGIRVDKESLVKQLKYKNEEYKLDNSFCKDILNDEYPLSIGGGIGQSRLCMFFLRKAHIGEVQVSIWNDEEIERLKKNNIHLL